MRGKRTLEAVDWSSSNIKRLKESVKFYTDRKNELLHELRLTSDILEEEKKKLDICLVETVRDKKESS
jgi:hypothetical protein